MITAEIKAELDKELDPSRIAQVAIGGGNTAPYLKAHDVIETANRIFGYDGWSYRIVGSPIYIETAGLYMAEVEVTVLGVTRADIGTNVLQGGQRGPQPSHHEMSIKGAVSDALKRALRTFGNQFGNDLYEKDVPADQGSTPRQQAPQQRPARNGNGEIRNAGDLLSWAHMEHKMPKAEVLKALGIQDVKEVTDFSDAKQRILLAATGGA